MDQSLDHTIALLTQTPATLNALLCNLPGTWTTANEGDTTWNATTVLAHLVNGERTDWLPRVQFILEHGDAETFPPVLRVPKDTKPLSELLDEFTQLRAESLTGLRALNLQLDDMDRRGRHPTFGPVTLSQLLATWATHDLTHLHQLSRILAHQYREAVGPWSAFLGVLHCNGHGA